VQLFFDGLRYLFADVELVALAVRVLDPRQGSEALACKSVVSRRPEAPVGSPVRAPVRRDSYTVGDGDHLTALRIGDIPPTRRAATQRRGHAARLRHRRGFLLNIPEYEAMLAELAARKAKRQADAELQTDSPAPKAVGTATLDLTAVRLPAATAGPRFKSECRLQISSRSSSRVSRASRASVWSRGRRARVCYPVSMRPWCVATNTRSHRAGWYRPGSSRPDHR
jgi:hypothetical protein